MSEQPEPADTQRQEGEESGAVPTTLSDSQQRLLLRLLRVAYPHPNFPDAPYNAAAQAVLEADGPANVLTDGLADLDRRAGGDFAGLSDEQATTVIEQIADGPLFALVHGATIVALYDQPEVWQLLGYEGPSFDQGGYINRGFDDLDWLPDARIEEYDGEPRVEIVTATGEGR